tara:strand:- start:1186 stop:1824 length:639 start_codon:yes stop_codon:yes gene_type:complete
MAKLLELSPQDNENIIKELLTTCKTLSKGSIRLNLSQKKLLLQIFESKTLTDGLTSKLNKIVTRYSQRPFKTIKETLPSHPPPIAKISSSKQDKDLKKHLAILKMSSSKQDEEIQKRLAKLRKVSTSSRKTQKRQISNDRKFAEKLQLSDDRKFAEKLQQEEEEKKIQEYNDLQLARKVGIMGSAAFAKGKTFRIKKKSKSPPSKKYRKPKK